MSIGRPETFGDEAGARVSLKMVLCGQYTFYFVALKLKGSHEAIVYALLDAWKLSVAAVFFFLKWPGKSSLDEAPDRRDPVASAPRTARFYRSANEEAQQLVVEVGKLEAPTPLTANYIGQHQQQQQHGAP